MELGIWEERSEPTQFQQGLLLAECTFSTKASKLDCGITTPINPLNSKTQAMLLVLCFNCMCTGSINSSTGITLPHVCKINAILLITYASHMLNDIVAKNGIFINFD